MIEEGLNCDENHNVDAEYMLQPKVEELNDERWSCVDCGRRWSLHMETEENNLPQSMSVSTVGK